MLLVKGSKFEQAVTLDLKDAKILTFKFEDVIFGDADQFVFKIGQIENIKYAFTNTGVLRFKGIDYGTLKNGENQIAVQISRNGETICSDIMTIISEIQGQITLPEVTVNSDTLLKDVTAINTQGAVVTGNIDNSVITESENQVFISKGYLRQDKTFEIGGSSDVQGFILNNIPCFATEVILTNPDLAKDQTYWANWWDWRKNIEYLPDMNTANATTLANCFTSFEKLKVCPNLNTAKTTSMQAFFQYCYELQSVPLLDTAKATSFIYCFNQCKKLKTIPLLDFSKGKSFSSCFSQCISLETIPQINTSSATEFSYTFDGCTSLHTVPALHAQNVTNLNSMFKNCTALTNFGGLIGVKKSWSLQWCEALTHDSLLNVLNGLADLTGGTIQTLTLGSINLAKLTSAEKAIATNKNWALA